MGMLSMYQPGHVRMEEMVEAAVEAYTVGRSEGDQLSLAMAELVGDALITQGTLRTARDMNRQYHTHTNLDILCDTRSWLIAV